MIDQVEPKTPAAAAGLQPGDIIPGFERPAHLQPDRAGGLRRETSEGADLLSSGARRQAAHRDTVTPQLLPNEEKTPRIGIGWDTSGQMTIAHPNPIEQVYNSITSTLETIGAVASPKSDVKLQHLSGPLGIVRIYYLLFERRTRLAAGALVQRRS